MPYRYKNIEKLNTSTGRRYVKNAIYPDVPVNEDDIYIISTIGDRYDVLAQQFYGDSSLWWVIATANNSKRDGLILEPGVQLRIPANAEEVLQLFDTLNMNR
jgi:nucleoid-associated protein YgaU